METNVNLRMLINDRMIPIMRAGNRFQVKDSNEKIHNISMDWNTYMFSIDDQEMTAQDFYYHFRDLLQISAPGSSLMINGQYYLPICQIDSFIPRLECAGKRFNSWKRCP